MTHELTLCRDFLGGDHAECDCGWVGPDVKGLIPAHESWEKHCEEAKTP